MSNKENINTGLVQLASMQSLNVLNEAVSKLCTEIEVLRDERDEYKRKWMEAIKTNEEPSIKQITS